MHCAVGDLKIEVSQRPGVVRLDWRGKSNDRQPEAALVPFFKEVTASAQSKQSGVEMHFEELEFFNSSTITAIIQYVKDLREKKVKLAVFFNARHKWQKIFFDALWIFEKDDGLFKITAAS